MKGGKKEGWEDEFLFLVNCGLSCLVLGYCDWKGREVCLHVCIHVHFGFFLSSQTCLNVLLVHCMFTYV